MPNAAQNALAAHRIGSGPRLARTDRLSKKPANNARSASAKNASPVSASTVPITLLAIRMAP